MRWTCLFCTTMGSAAVLLGGCVSPVHVTHDVIELGNSVGLSRPYENVRVYPQDAQRIYRALLRVLDLRGSQLLAADETSGVVSWVDIGSSFVAISSQLAQDRSSRASRLSLSLPSWRGIVYGSARIKPLEQQTWLLIKSAGRDRTTGGVSFSEGTYERSLLNEVAREAARSIPGSAADLSPARGRSAGAPQGSSYSELYTKHFFNTPEPDTSLLKSVGRKEVFPARVADVWAACIDLIAQMDTLIQVSAADRWAVFAHSVAVPQRGTDVGSNAAAVDVNVIFVLSVEPRGSQGTTVSLAFLAPDGLALRPIVDVSRKEEAVRLKDPKTSPTAIAAALVANEFFGRVTTQIYHEERWRKKLGMRSRAGP